MSAAGVTLTELNYTYNVDADSTVYTASVFPARRGLVGRYNSANTTEEFIRKSTPAEWIESGYHVGYYDALQILQRSTNYGFVRAANNPLYSSATLVYQNNKKLDLSTVENQTLNFSGGRGVSDLNNFNMDTFSGREATPITTLTKISSSTFEANSRFMNTSEEEDEVLLWVKSDYEADPKSTPLITGKLVKTNVSNNIIQISYYDSVARSEQIYEVPDDITESEFIIANKYNQLITEEDYLRCVLIYEYSPGMSNIAIKVYPYRYQETLTIGNFVEDKNEIISNQDWGPTEPVRFVTKYSVVDPLTGEVSYNLPTNIDSGIAYYLVRDPETGYFKIHNSKNQEVEYSLPNTNLNITLMPLDSTKCNQEGCFTIEVFNSKSGDVPIESWTVSRHPDSLDSSGLSTYITRVLERSYYIRAIDNVFVDEDKMPLAQTSKLYLKGGSYGDIVTDSHMISAAQILRNSTEVPLTLVSDAGWATTGYQKELIDICESRRDCLPIFSVPYDSTVGPDALMKTVDYRNGYASASGGLGSTRFGALYTPWVQITSPYTDSDIYIPPSGVVVGIICKNAANTQMWSIPAGFKRGIIPAKGLSKNWSYTLQGTGDIATLIDNQVNPIIKDSDGSLVIWGNETLMSMKNDMSALNNSLVMIIIQPAIVHLLRKYATFENITSDVLDDIQILISNYLDKIKGNLGISDFLVICDSSNNTEATISQNTIIVDVAHRPMNYIKSIQYRHTITRNLDSTTIVSSAMSS